MRPLILVVNDDDQLLEFFREIFEQDGFEVHVALSGCAAPQQAEALEPDVILLDVGVPTQDMGVETLRRLRESAATRTIPVVLSWDVGESAGFNLSRDVGADGYVNMPCSPLALLTLVRALLPKDVA